MHTGRVCSLNRDAGWLSVQDNNFSLHLNEDAIASTWMVNNPTVDGVVTSLEFYSQECAMIAQLTGQLELGLAGDASWRRILSAMIQPRVSVSN